MISYIKSEFYRILHHKWTFLFIILCSVLLLSSNIVLAVVQRSDSSFQWATTKFSFSNLYSNMLTVYILCVTVSGMLFGNEHTNHTMKNCISYGISRGTIYFGKLIVQIIYALLAFAIITGVYVLSGYLLLENSGNGALYMIFDTFAACLPFFLFALAATNCFVFIIESAGASATATLMLLIGFPLICNMLALRFELFQKIATILPWNLITNIDFDDKSYIVKLFWDTKAGLGCYWVVGITEMLIVMIFGYLIFRKQEIK